MNNPMHVNQEQLMGLPFNFAQNEHLHSHGMETTHHARNNAQDGDEENNHQNYDEDPMLRSKPRIPWDRNPRGDRNGLKYALLRCIDDNQFHINGRYRENFQTTSEILSSGGSPFCKYKGIEPSGAQRKFNVVLRDVSKTFRLTEIGDFSVPETAEAAPFESLALKMLKDLIEKEKIRKANRRISKGDGSSSNNNNSGLDDSMMEDMDTDLVGLLRKRKSDMVELKQTMRKAAAVAIGEDPQSPTGNSHPPTTASATSAGITIHRLDTTKHDQVVAELQTATPPILTVGDLLQAADISTSGITSFQETTSIKLNKPVDRLLKIYVEMATAPDYVYRMKTICGLNAGDALGLEDYLKPFYQAQ
jgi:hypothetical protein